MDGQRLIREVASLSECALWPDSHELGLKSPGIRQNVPFQLSQFSLDNAVFGADSQVRVFGPRAVPIDLAQEVRAYA
jgi:hypothetical protein